MKKTVAILLLLATVLAFAACGDDNSGVPTGMKLASNPEIVDYSLFVPEDWEIISATGMTMAQVSRNDVSNVIVTHHTVSSVPPYADTRKILLHYFYGANNDYAALEVEAFNYDDSFLASVNRSLYGEKTEAEAQTEGEAAEEEAAEISVLGGYFERLVKLYDTITDENGNEVSSFTVTSPPTFTTLKKGEKEVAALKLVYTATLDDANVKQIMVLSYDDAYFYNITCTCEPTYYDSIVETFDAVIGYFTFDH